MKKRFVFLFSVITLFFLGYEGFAVKANAEQLSGNEGIVTSQINNLVDNSLIEANYSKLMINKGSSKTVGLTYGNAILIGSAAKWSSSTPSVATVTNGNISAIGEGNATITAVYDNHEVSIEVTVYDPSLKANFSKLTLSNGKSTTIGLTYDSETLPPSKAKWDTSNSSVVTISDGELKARGKGVATVSAKYGGKEVKINVTVTDSELKANISKTSINVGETKEILLTYDDKAMLASKATWSTTKTSVATVTDGVIKAKGKGTATISAKYAGKEVRIDVTVIDVNLLKANTKNVSVYVGDTQKISLTYDEKTLSGSKAKWSTSKSSVVTVTDGVIKAKSRGTAIITAKYADKEVQINVNVSKIILKANVTNTSISKGKSKTITLNYNDKNLSGSKAKWSTSKSSVATVTDGVIRAKSKGTAIITAKYGGEEVEIKVTVN
ncbi:Ig-like domain-containing protein [Brevibacillus choshinensis]|uniref:Ig-like domain-containing surface protein n=1 Tax=Brevibacillus choshinensis TaxID=54911 RepID=A0ABX7FI32_BRECH|nr:Ig-like domain-containing surface protein [Brevibacillus choshinensis]QRG65264.1 Ig-like domain-containing surface protein [Brevibacillus choshinensis]